MQSAVEMNSARLFAARQVYLNHKLEYESLFGALPPLDDTKRFPVVTPQEAGCRKLDASSNLFEHGRLFVHVYVDTALK